MTYSQNTNRRYELIDKNGNVAGTFINAASAAGSAALQWPDQEQDPERTGKGWDISVAGADR